MKRFRIIGFILSLVLTIGCLSGCGTTKGDIKEEDPNAVPDSAYEINWYLMGETLMDTASVEAKVNEYLKDKINATLKINRLEMQQYQQKMNAMIASNEYFDIAFCANWMLDYKANAANGAFVALDDYMDKYLPETSAMLGKDVINNIRVNGKAYAVPANKEFAESRGIVYRKDIAEKYNIDMSDIKSIEELEPVLLKIKQSEPDIQYPIDWGTDRTPVTLVRYDPLTPYLAIFYERDQDKIFNFIETDEFVEACKTARRFYELGLIKKDIMTAKDFSQRLKDGKVFAYMEYLKPGKAQETARNFTFELGQTYVTPIIELNQGGIGSMMAISQTSKNPVRAMRFLELLNTDKYLNNLINYGIEGKHYTKIDENYIDIVPNTPYTLQGSQWMTGNVFLNYLTRGEEADKMQKLEEFNKSAKRPLHYGFQFNQEPVQQEIAACSTVHKEYWEQVVLGGMDPMPVIEKFREKLKAAGVDKVLAEAQKQYDEFLASKK